MAISKRLRFEVLRRDDHTCQYCGESAPDVKLTVDHVKPVALGGKDSPENLVAACKDCNAGKSSVNLDAPMVEAIAQRNLDWAERAAMVSAKMRGTIERDQAYVEYFEYAWDERNRAHRRAAELPAGYRATLMHWAEIGVPDEALDLFLDVAMNKPRVSDEDVFTYLCGIVWNRIKQADIPLEIPEEPMLYTENDRADYGIDSYEKGWKDGRLNAFVNIADNPWSVIAWYDPVATVVDGRAQKPLRHLFEHHPALSEHYEPLEKEADPWPATTAV